MIFSSNRLYIVIAHAHRPYGLGPAGAPHTRTLAQSRSYSMIKIKRSCYMCADLENGFFVRVVQGEDTRTGSVGHSPRRCRSPMTRKTRFPVSGASLAIGIDDARSLRVSDSRAVRHEHFARLFCATPLLWHTYQPG